MRKLSLTQQIFIGLIIGIIVGYIIHRADSAPGLQQQLVESVNRLEVEPQAKTDLLAALNRVDTPAKAADFVGTVGKSNLPTSAKEQVLASANGLSAAYKHKEEWIQWVRVLSRIFLSLIKMLIAPLIFSTLVVGIAGAGDMRKVGRVGLKAMAYFTMATLLALVIGLVAVNLTKPGLGVNLPSEQSAEAKEIAANASKMTPQSHIVNIFPTSLIKSMAENDVLQIVVFSLIFAVALAGIGEKARPMIAFCESLSEAMFKFTNYVMKFAPWGVGAAIAVTVGGKGLWVLWNLAKLILTLYGALAVFILIVLVPVAFLIRLPFKRFFQLVKEPATLAFVTTSSESAFPKALENMERLGVPRRIVSFILPLGYSFNLDGSTLYLSLAALFVRGWLKIYHRLEIHGCENLPAAGSYVMVANHASHLDALCLLAALPLQKLHRAFPAAAQDYFFVSVPRLAVAAIVVNALPFGRQTQIRHSLELCRSLLENSGNILILFPEGTRTPDGRMGEFRPGIGQLLAGSKIPVVPCFLAGAHAAWPKGRRLPRPRKLQLRIGLPRTYAALPAGRESATRISSELQQAVAALATSGQLDGCGNFFDFRKSSRLEKLNHENDGT